MGRAVALFWACFLGVVATTGPTRAETPSSVGAPVAAPVEPTVDIYTMGPGEHLFTRFGHAAVCVRDEKTPGGRCYNYGTADFSTPGPLTFGVVRGNAIFWVSVTSLPSMLASYARQGRAVYKQTLPVGKAVTEQLIRELHAADVRETTFYHYNHFRDNCTTRLRDLVDRAVGGRLRGATADHRVDPPLRSYVRTGLAGDVFLLTVSDLVLGREVDRPTSRWEGMFLPSVFRAELALRLGAQPAVEVTGREEPHPSETARRGGVFLLVGLAGVAALLTALLRKLGRERAARLSAGLLPGLIGFFVWGLAIASPLPELRYNEVLLLCWPTDLLLPALSASRLRGYLTVRLVALGAALLLSGLHVLIQPVAGPALLALVPMTVLYAYRPLREVASEELA